MNEKICFITSTVHPLPSIWYIWVLLHFHSYQSGIVCSRAHSVGVKHRRTSSAVRMVGACPAWAEQRAGLMPSTE